jgi:HPt (histidine-containing phosphotransfer) domain-containing protein
MVAKVRTRPLADQRREPNPSVLDLGHLRRYTMDSPELERELIGLFLKQLPSLRDDLGNAADSKEWKFATHTLKGSARVVGATAIALIAASMEEQGLGRPEALAALDAAVSAFREAVSQFDA